MSQSQQWLGIVRPTNVLHYDRLPDMLVMLTPVVTFPKHRLRGFHW